MHAEEQTALDRLRIDIFSAYELPGDTDVASLSEPLKTYVDYALQTVERGRTALTELDDEVRHPGFRFLDVGCAYGGFLHAALEAGASRAVGTEIDERFRKVAEGLATVHGARCEVTSTDVCDPVAMAELGEFDAVVCADVLEHVSDPAAAIANLIAALAPDGRVYAAIPNSTAVGNVLSDPHFQLAGITLLPPDAAQAYYQRVSGSTYYDVGDYLTAQQYIDLFAQAGGTAALTNVPQDHEWLLDQARQDAVTLLRQLRARTYVGAATAATARHVLQFLALHTAWRAGRRWSPGRVERLGQHLCVKYGIRTWHFRASRA